MQTDGYAFCPYRLIRPLLFMLDAETAHGLAIAALKIGFLPSLETANDPVLRTKIGNLAFPNPVGLAAGFDKNAEVMDALFGLGFGFVEVGSITPKPQPGNPKPRMFRVPEAEAVINRLGFNSQGAQACLEHLKTRKKKRGITGINLGKNKETEDAAADYVLGMETFAAFADYVTVNISSPNTPGLRDLQRRAELAELMQKVMTARNKSASKPPVFVKIAPDQSEEQMDDIAEVALTSGIDGLIIGNTTVTRPSIIPSTFAKETGGLSGKPLFEMSTQVLSAIYKRTQGKLPIIGCGGIASGADAYAKIRAGASLVQLYTALVYQGPSLICRINNELAALLKRDGFTSIKEAVGANHI